MLQSKSISRTRRIRIWAWLLGGLVVLSLSISGEVWAETSAPTAEAETSAPTAEVRKIILEKGCQACHVIPGIPEAKGKTGPSLTDFSKRRRIAGGKLKNTPKSLRKWLTNPSQVKMTMMPNSGLTQKEIDLLIAFLFTL